MKKNIWVVLGILVVVAVVMMAVRWRDEHAVATPEPGATADQEPSTSAPSKVKSPPPVKPSPAGER